MIIEKECNTCKIIKPLTLFHSDRTHTDGKRSSCSECCSKLKKERIKKEFTITTDKYKICFICKKELETKYFHKNKRKKDGLVSQCNFCRSIKTQDYYERNKEKIKEKTFDYYLNNKNKIKKTRQIYVKNKKISDPIFKLQRRLRNRLYYALQKKSWKKNTHFSEYIGCELTELKLHLEAQFKEGMTWENHGKWHIDHIIPLSSAKTEEELYKLCHYTNLQPLWAKDNIIKGDKLKICWQKLKRDKYLKEDLDKGMPKTSDIKDFQLFQEKFTQEHKEFIKKYEWLGNPGYSIKWCFVARCNGLLGGVVLISEPNSYQFGNLEALIQRGACASWTPKNLGSKLVMFSCRWMIKNTNKRIFTAYSDPKAGEIGTIYQACNFDYLGNTYGDEYKYELPSKKLVSSRYFTRTSSIKKWVKKMGLEWDNNWLKPNKFLDLTKIPKDIFEKAKNYGLNYKKSLKKVKFEFKGKYVLLLKLNKREKLEKTWSSLPYPKRY